ncbi:HNH_endonuclease [Hexamita inflata]|uniref:HNH endonuclease n=1 Tax=Hexamita inflata TaxID=28002 RepID=A0AA86Q855_9EUKA|nr:HNH endonuclease [Hexamita inflata]
MQTKLNVSPIESDISQLESLEDLEIYSEEFTESFDQDDFIEANKDQVKNVVEQGRFIIGFPDYVVTSMGRIICVSQQTELKLYVSNRGYFMINLKNELGWSTFTVHSLVANAFLGLKPTNFQVDHINRDKQNNCIENLRYISVSDNQKNKTKYGTHSAEYFQQLPTNCIQFKSYNQHIFENYFVDTNTKQLYSFANNQYFKITLTTNKNTRYQFYVIKNTLGKNVSIYLSKLLQNDFNK